MNPNQIIDIFRRSGTLDETTAEELLAEAINSGREIDDIMIEQAVVTEEDFSRILAAELGVEAVDLAGFEPLPAVIRLIPSGMARLHEVLPINASGNVLTVALGNPLDTQALEDLRFTLNREITQVVAPRHAVLGLIATHYGSEETSMEDVLRQLNDTEVTEVEEGEEDFNAAAVAAEANSTPIIRYVDLILDRAVQAQASDIHFEPFEKDFKIRYRVDGALYEMEPPPRHLAAAAAAARAAAASPATAETDACCGGAASKLDGGSGGVAMARRAPAAASSLRRASSRRRRTTSASRAAASASSQRLCRSCGAAPTDGISSAG